MREALSAARDMLRKIPEDFAVAAAVFVDPLASIEISALMRFGLWEEILAHPRPAEHLPITIAMTTRAAAMQVLITESKSIPVLGRIPSASGPSAVATTPKVATAPLVAPSDSTP